VLPLKCSGPATTRAADPVNVAEDVSRYFAASVFSAAFLCFLLCFFAAFFVSALV